MPQAVQFSHVKFNRFHLPLNAELLRWLFGDNKPGVLSGFRRSEQLARLNRKHGNGAS